MITNRRHLRSLLCTALALWLCSFAGSRAAERAQEKKTVALAVIVHPKNPVSDLKLREARQIMKLDKQFWKEGQRVELFLPARNSEARAVMLDKVYDMSDEALRKYFVGKVYSGEIPREPSVARSTKAAGTLVSRSEGAISVIPASEVPADVKVLSIDGKKPGEEGYPLVGEVTPQDGPEN